jgi:putative endonuclease
MPEHFPTIATPQAVPSQAFVYILQSADGSLYIGQTVNVAERLRKHRYGLGSKFTSDHAAPRLIYCEGPMPTGAAVSREAQLKRWSRAKKEALVRGDASELHRLSRSRENSLLPAQSH